jgi:hypothetical protein
VSAPDRLAAADPAWTCPRCESWPNTPDMCRARTEPGAYCPFWSMRLRPADSPESPCRDCGAQGFRLTDGRCDGCHEASDGAA